MSRVERMAARLVEARAGGALVDPAVEPAPRTLEEVYRVQDLVLAALAPSVRAAAWKAIPPRPGAGPAASPVPAGHVVSSPAKLAAGRALLGVEAEIAFRLGEDLQPEEALAVIELCETRIADWANAPPLWKLADFQSNATLIVGGGTRSWRDIDFSAQRVELSVNRSIRAQAVGAHPATDPSTLLPWMLGHCASRGGLRPGDIVTTGSWVGIVAASPGEELVARFPGIGEAVLTLL